MNSTNQVFPASDCLCAVYARKHPVSPTSTPETVLMVDVGRLQTTVVVARFGEAVAAGGREGDVPGAKSDKKDEPSVTAAAGTAAGAGVVCPYSVLAVQSDENLGAFHFDRRMFQHFQGLVSGSRLFGLGCRKNSQPRVVRWVADMCYTRLLL